LTNDDIDARLKRLEDTVRKELLQLERRLVTRRPIHDAPEQPMDTDELPPSYAEEQTVSSPLLPPFPGDEELTRQSRPAKPVATPKPRPQSTDERPKKKSYADTVRDEPRIFPITGPIPDKYIWETYCQKPALPPDYYKYAESVLPPHPYLTHLARELAKPPTHPVLENTRRLFSGWHSTDGQTASWKTPRELDAFFYIFWSVGFHNKNLGIPSPISLYQGPLCPFRDEDIRKSLSKTTDDCLMFFSKIVRFTSTGFWLDISDPETKKYWTKVSLLMTHQFGHYLYQLYGTDYYKEVQMIYNEEEAENKDEIPGLRLTHYSIKFVAQCTLCRWHSTYDFGDSRSRRFGTNNKKPT
jgi:hypothetical protein